MDIVIDASALIAVLAGEPEREHLLSLTIGANLIAPPSVHWEIGNAFSAMLRRGRTDLSTVLDALSLYGEIPIRFVAIELAESVEMAGRLGIYAYDAYLLTCARRYRAPLLTLDVPLRTLARRVDVAVLEVTS